MLYRRMCTTSICLPSALSNSICTIPNNSTCDNTPNRAICCARCDVKTTMVPVRVFQNGTWAFGCSSVRNQKHLRSTGGRCYFCLDSRVDNVRYLCRICWQTVLRNRIGLTRWSDLRCQKCSDFRENNVAVLFREPVIVFIKEHNAAVGT